MVIRELLQFQMYILHFLKAINKIFYHFIQTTLYKHVLFFFLLIAIISLYKSNRSDTMVNVEFKNVCKYYKVGEVSTKALDKASFTIDEGELVTIVGPSGSGKSTCLNILGGMDSATSGTVLCNGKEVSKFTEKELINYRKNNIGFVFQFYNLIQNLTVIENLELAASRTNDKKDLDKLLEQVGLLSKKDNFPSQLSGGEQQRVSIARALAKSPNLLLCDEPTGALDYESSKQVLKLIEETNKKYNVTTIIITHNEAITPMADKIIKFKNGKVESIKKNKKRASIDDLEW